MTLINDDMNGFILNGPEEFPASLTLLECMQVWPLIPDQAIIKIRVALYMLLVTRVTFES